MSPDLLKSKGKKGKAGELPSREPTDAEDSPRGLAGAYGFGIFGLHTDLCGSARACAASDSLRGRDETGPSVSQVVDFHGFLNKIRQRTAKSGKVKVNKDSPFLYDGGYYRSRVILG
ncbi:MAG: hypothetical protein CMM07_01430 [Rhodopirellula sp.]|nr:hypothetical protein [Rhodopirellula sp.]